MGLSVGGCAIVYLRQVSPEIAVWTKARMSSGVSAAGSNASREAVATLGSVSGELRKLRKAGSLCSILGVLAADESAKLSVDVEEVWW